MSTDNQIGLATKWTVCPSCWVKPGDPCVDLTLSGDVVKFKGGVHTERMRQLTPAMCNAWPSTKISQVAQALGFRSFGITFESLSPYTAPGGKWLAMGPDGVLYGDSYDTLEDVLTSAAIFFERWKANTDQKRVQKKEETKTADQMREEAAKVADDARRELRDAFDRQWGYFAKCSTCGNRAGSHMSAAQSLCKHCAGKVQWVRYTPPPK